MSPHVGRRGKILDMNHVESGVNEVLGLRVGERVRVKSRQDILATLDQNGTLDRLPFMPEMLPYCGREFTVFKRADKTCDTIEKSGGRRMVDAVHLEGSRCNGSAHGGCGAQCLMFWKEAWLERAGSRETSLGRRESGLLRAAIPSLSLTEAQLLTTTTRPSVEESGDGPIFRCQVTEIRNFTTSMSSWDIRQYVRDVWSGNIGIGDILSALTFRFYQRLLRLPGLRIWLGIYNGFQKLRDGVPYPCRQGRVTGKTPSEQLYLQPGELVQIKSYDEILDTLNENNKNRGLWFDAEQVPYCGKTVKVLCRVERIINERTGKMMKLPNDCLILEGVYCRAHYSSDRLFCPRSIYSYWREVWLKRVSRVGEGAVQR
jgi:hypothetical protein